MKEKIRKFARAIILTGLYVHRPKCITLHYEEDDFLKLKKEIIEDCFDFVREMPKYNEDAVSFEVEGQRFDIIKI